MNPEIQWFCYEGLRADLLDGESCRQLGRVMGEDCDLLNFAQAVIDHGLIEDIERVQEILNTAYEQAQTGTLPPVNVFALESAAEQEEEAETVAEEPPAPRPRPDTSYTMPDLDTLGPMSDDQAAALMSQLLRACRAAGASDLHLSAGTRPFVRHQLTIQYLTDTPLDPGVASQLNTVLLDPPQAAQFERKRDFDYALALADDDRYRVNLMVHKLGVAGTYRLVPDRIRTLEELGFANVKTLRKLLAHQNGLILVTGPLGSGKTTTLAALVDIINAKRLDHIITVEDPLEIVQESKGCNVTQREVGGHTDSFAAALKAALREDPDIIVIGELRDLTTIEMAITAAETGHLVIGTLHTRDAATTLGRLLDVFPPSQQQQIRSMTAESLRGVICQRLLPGTDGGVVVGLEILINTIAVANIIRENKMHQLRSVMQTGQHQGMVTMDDSLYSLYQEGRISEATALANIQDSAIANRLRNEKSVPTSEAPPDADAKRKRGWFR